MLYCLAAIASFMVQNLSCKEYGRRFPNTLYTQAVMLVAAPCVTGLIMALLGGTHALNGKGTLIAFLFGVFFVLTVSTMTLAMHYGPMGLSILIRNGSLMVPVLFGVIVWKEQLTILKIIGICCVIALLALSAFATPDDGAGTYKDRKKWLLFTLLSFIGDSGLSILQGFMSRECATTDSVTFTFWTSLFTAAAALALVILCAARGQRNPIARDAAGNDRRLPMLLCWLGIGAGTAGGNCFTIMALLSMASVVLFPVRMGGLVLVMWLIGVLVYREKVTKTGLMMLVIGLSGIVLLNL